MITHKTKGIVVKVVRYGDTSIIAAIYTGLFGMQSYIVNGVRSSSKKGAGRGNLFQPGAILDLVVYHQEIKNLQRIKEFKWAHIYEQLYFNVYKNAILLFMIEVLQRVLKQPEQNSDLFDFIEDALLHLDRADHVVTGNFPLYFAVHLASFFGFRISDNHSGIKNILDLQEGEFVSGRPDHSWYLEGEHAQITSILLRIMHPEDLRQLRLNQETRRTLLHAYETFYMLHQQDFGKLKTLPILETVMQ